jgi:hypothetical protein
LIESESIDTQYLSGESYYVGYEKTIPSTVYGRDDWAWHWLSDRGIEPRSCNHLRGTYHLGQLVGYYLDSYDYKK